MRKSRVSAVAAATALTTAFGVTTLAAAATATWTVTPGENFRTSLFNYTSHFFDTTAGSSGFGCHDLQMSGRFKSGTGLTNPVGSIASIGYDNDPGQPVGCATNFGEVGLVFSTAKFHALRYDPAKNLVTGSLAGIHATISGLGGFACSGTIDGTGSTASNGLVRFRYSNSSGQLQTDQAGDNLHLYNVSGCGGVFSNGDALTLEALFPLTSSSGHINTITSP